MLVEEACLEFTAFSKFVHYRTETLDCGVHASDSCHWTWNLATQKVMSMKIQARYQDVTPFFSKP